MPVFSIPCSHAINITQTSTFGYLNPPSKVSGIAVALFQIRGSSLICIHIAVLRNSYDYPHRDTLERLAALGSKVIGTAGYGEIIVKIEDGKVQVER